MQESHKELGLKTQRKRVPEEIAFPVSFYNKRGEKSCQEKQTEEHEVPSTYPVGYGFRWNVVRDYDESAKHFNTTIPDSDARFFSTCAITNAPQDNNFYNSRAHHAAAFAAAAAAAVAFQQETTNSSIDSAVQMKEESHTDCGGHLMGQNDYPLTDSWVCGGELKCILSPKDADRLAGQNGFSGFWQSPFQPVRSDDRVHSGMYRF